MLLPWAVICVGWKLTIVGTGSYVNAMPGDINTSLPIVTSRVTDDDDSCICAYIGLMHRSDDDVR